MSAETPLRTWIDAPADASRAARQWSAIEGGLGRRRSPLLRWGLALGGAAALAAAVWGGVRVWGPAGPPSAGLAEASTLVLADGSHVALSAGARVEVTKNEPKDIAVTLQGGTAGVDVVPDRERSFRVLAGEVEVRVVGTAFQVEIDPGGDVHVSVQHGIVEVRAASRPGDVRRLGAGETWSLAAAAAPAPPGDPAAPDPSSAASADAPVAPASAGAPASAAPASSNRAPGASASAAGPDAEARALFEAANNARRAGDLAKASSLYRALGQRFPDDPRARLAALELARIEMDRGKDLSAAEAALRAASSADPGSSVQEDALARLVSLHASKGDLRACKDARARYLAAYPAGVHAAQVRAACGAP